MISVLLICLFMIWIGFDYISERFPGQAKLSPENWIGAFLLGAAILAIAGVIVGVLFEQYEAPLLWFAGVIGLMFLGMGYVMAQSPEQIVAVVLYGMGGLFLIIAFCSTAIWSRVVSGGAPENGNAAVLSMLAEIHKQSMLSDTARRVLYRERELELLRRTIENDVNRGDFNAALVLCQDMEKLFGYNEEADTARSRVLELRNAALSEDIQQQVTEVHRLLSAGRWRRARQLAIRLHRLYPDSPQLEELEHNIEVVIKERKQSLQVEFDGAVAAGDTERSMNLLRELDRYLEREEAEALRSSAQEVIAEHRRLLKKQFRDAVSGHDWQEAVRCGERITMEYPMDTMADEVGEMMERLRERANEIAEDPRSTDGGKGSPGGLNR